MSELLEAFTPESAKGAPNPKVQVCYFCKKEIDKKAQKGVVIDEENEDIAHLECLPEHERKVKAASRRPQN